MYVITECGVEFPGLWEGTWHELVNSHSPHLSSPSLHDRASGEGQCQVFPDGSRDRQKSAVPQSRLGINDGGQVQRRIEALLSVTLVFPFPIFKNQFKVTSGKLVVNILMFNFSSFQGLLRHPSPYMDSIIINIPARPPGVLLFSVLRSLLSPFPPESELCFNSHLSWKDANTKSSSVFRRRQWHPTPVFLPGKSHGRRSLVGCSPWGR